MPSDRKIAADAIIIVKGKVLMMLRAQEPFSNHWVVPGGRIELHEDIEECCKREIFEEVGLKIKIEKIVGIYSSPKRDPRQTVAVAFLCTAKGKPRLSDEALEIRFFDPKKLPKKVGFDHRKIIRDAIKLGKK